MRHKKTIWIYIILIAILVMAASIPVFSFIKKMAQDTLCAANFKALSAAVQVYTNEYDQLPPENWCDIFVEEWVIYPQYLVCPASGAVRGESSYAMNKNIAGMKYSELPVGVVLFFETDMGLENGFRKTPITQRIHYDAVRASPDYYGFVYDEETLVFKDRFNQYGGPEDAAFRHRHDGKDGCHVMCVGCYMEFVPADRIADLKWTAE